MASLKIRAGAWGRRLGAVALMAGMAALGGCTVHPATGQREFTLMSKSQEEALGAQAHPKLLQQFGGPYDDPKAAGYVAAIGGRMAANSELAGDGFTFTLLNSKIVNAFALPGGYVYISRGLLALMNDEAELASVLGHEVGHVTARHTARRQTQSTLGSILGAGVGILTGSSELANLTMQGAQIYLLSYSRDQEYQADGLGVRYMTRAGYDPYGAPRMLSLLGAQTSLDAKILGQQEAEQVPNWARTHPLTEDRVKKALGEARETGLAPGSHARNRDALLNAIDGMLYDDDPSQGVIRGKSFWHPKLKLTFTAPDGFALQNGETSVIANGPDQAAIVFAGGKLQAGQDITQYLQALWGELSGGKAGALSDMERIDVNGMKAATGSTQLNSQSGAIDLRIVAIQYDANTAYQFLFLSAPGQTAALADPYRRATYSFRKISDKEAQGISARRIKVITVAAGDTIDKLAARMAYDDYKRERFMVLNGFENESQLKVGQRVKLIVYGK